MTVRVYITTVVGDGRTLQTAYRPVWRNILAPEVPAQRGIVGEAPHRFYIGQIDTTDSQHATLVADNRVRHVPTALIDETLGNLSPAARTALEEVLTFLGIATDIFSAQTTVKDVLFLLVGRTCWRGLPLTEGRASTT